MSKTAEYAGRAVDVRTAGTPPERATAGQCPQWCTNGPHEDADLHAWQDGQTTVVHEVYLLRQDGGEIIFEQLAHVSPSHETYRPMPASLYVHIEEEICCAETASHLATALFAAARLVAQAAAPVSLDHPDPLPMVSAG